MKNVISIRGAREHNLKNVDLDIPRDKLVVMTGLSGSGKSSLAFDTIYAEGQRRYVESLSAYARQFLEMMQKPDVDQIDGLSPAISIEQKTTSKNPRSTVGTVTEIYDYMRLLFARVGVPYSPATGLPIESQTVSQMVDRIMDMPEGTRLLLLAPIVRGRKGEYRKELQDLSKRGYQRVKIDGEMYEIDEAPALNKKLKHDIEVVVDRIVVREGLGNRIADSLEQALGLADGLAFAENADTGERTTFSAKFACPVSGFTIPEIEPRLFSFNNPFGACPSCDGLGEKLYFDPMMVVPNEALSLEKGAIAPWANSTSQYYVQTLESLARHYKVSMKTPWEQLPEEAKQGILYGSAGKPVTMAFTPHLIPMNRGEFVTTYVRLAGGNTPDDLRAAQRLRRGLPEAFEHALEELRLQRADRQVLAVTTLVQAVVRQRPGQHVLAARLGPAMRAQRGDRDRLQRQRAIEHADIHERALPRVARADHRGQQADRTGQRTAGEIGDLHVRQHRRTARLAELVQHARVTAVVHVMPGAIAVRAGLAVAGQRRIDEPRVDLPQRLVAAAQLVHHAGAEGLNHHVGLGDHLLGRRHRLGPAQVECHRLLAAVDHREQLRRQRPRVVAAIRLLDLDDLGTELRQIQRAERPWQQARQVEHANAG